MQYGTRGWVGKHTSLPSCSSSTCARLALASAISEELTRGGADCVTNVPRCARCSPACRACIVVPWWKEDLSDVDSVRSNSWFPPLARRQHRMRADQLSWDRYRRAPVEGEREAHKAAHVVHWYYSATSSLDRDDRAKKNSVSSRVWCLRKHVNCWQTHVVSWPSRSRIRT
jgi:hypothetical protein